MYYNQYVKNEFNRIVRIWVSFRATQPNISLDIIFLYNNPAQPRLISAQPRLAYPKNTYTGQDGLGIGFQWLFENGNGTTNLVPSQVWDELRMENSYIFWDKNGIEGARPKPALSPSLGDDHLAWKHPVFPEACRRLRIAEGYDHFC